MMSLLKSVIGISVVVAVESLNAWRIRITSNDTQLALAQVLVFDQLGVNNALNESCLSVPGTQWPEPRGESQCSWAIDGYDGPKGELPQDNNEYFQSAATTGANWWEVRLQTNISVATVKVVNRADCCQENLLGATLDLFSNESDIPEYSTHLGPSDNPDTNYSVVISIPRDVPELETSSALLVVLVVMFIMCGAGVVLLVIYVQWKRMKDKKLRKRSAPRREMISDEVGPTELTSVLH